MDILIMEKIIVFFKSGLKLKYFLIEIKKGGWLLKYGLRMVYNFLFIVYYWGIIVCNISYVMKVKLL